MPKIKAIVAREILDSRGTPTIETSILLESGCFGTVSIPSGASTGTHEDVELRDKDPARYHGLGVLKAVNNVNTVIAPQLIGIDSRDQETIDKTMLELDGTKNESRLGANAILSISQAALKAAACYARQPLFFYLAQKYQTPQPLTIPHPTFNVINGGKHGAGNLDFQEFHIIPSTRYPFNQSLRIAVEIYMDLKEELIRRNAIHSVGDEGGFAPNLFTNSDALEILAATIRSSQLRLNQDIFFGLDVAANSFYTDKKYTIKDLPKSVDRQGLIDFYKNLMTEYQLFSLEDPLEEEDFDGWATLRTILPQSLLVIGDDLLTSNPERLTKAIQKKSVNAILLKPNQIGTITETVEVIRLAKQNNIYTIVSHRSGETNDTFIADFAVGLGANFTKFGAPVRGERVAKYNRLLEIEQFLARM